MSHIATNALRLKPAYLPLLLCLLSGCASEGGRKLPGVYRIDIQQGNVIQQTMLLRLKPGMDKNQVRFIMGTPAIIDPFHDNRWEYIYSLSRGGETRQQRHLILHFEDEQLAYVEGDVTPGQDDMQDPGKQTRTVDVPLEKSRKKGFFRNVFNTITGNDGRPRPSDGSDPPLDMPLPDEVNPNPNPNPTPQPTETPQ
ncbi:MAG: outer membrane protein assembly factor BamE [Gammaproteobacteria bacterium]